MFRRKLQSTSTKVIIITAATFLLIITFFLSASYQRLLTFGRVPRKGTISSILHSQNLSHAAFHNDYTKPYLLDLVTTHPRETVIIIGLARGKEALSISRTHHVYAVEPLPKFVQKFRDREPETTENITLFPVAASDQDGEIEVFYDDTRVRVPAKRIDGLLNRNTDVAVISVDVQGAEYSALKGVGDILKRTNSVWVEVGCSKYGEKDPTDMLEFLDETFALFDFVPWGRKPDVEDVWDGQQFVWGSRPDDIRDWVKWFCGKGKEFQWLQTDFVGIRRELLLRRPDIIDGMIEVGQRNCMENCYLREIAFGGVPRVFSS